MNTVVVTRYASDKSKFIHDATEWVLKNSVDRTLYSVGMNCDVRIGPYNIKFVSRMIDVRGLRPIDILYYHSVNSVDVQWEVEHRMTSDGKIFWGLDEFMEEVFRRAKEEQIKAKLNGLSGYRPMSINYPEYFLKLKEESQNKISDVQDILDYNVATVYDAVREARESEKLALLREAMDRIKKEETTMNCDIRSNIKDVIFNYPATIILWKDGTKTIVKVRKGEKYDPEKGFAMAVCKKMFGNEGNYYKVFKEYVPTPYYIPKKSDMVLEDRAIESEVGKIVADMKNKCREKNKMWPGLTMKQWKEIIDKAAKRVADKRKREEAEADCKKKKEGIKSGKYPWGMYMSKYMTPPEEGVNSSGKEE
jgi:hypothetical protein